VPLERARAVLAETDVAVEPSAPPWSGDDVVALLSWAPVDADDIARLPSLQVIATPSVGVDHVDVDAATARGVWVCNVPDYCVDEMADHAVALLLGLVRGVVELDRSVRAGVWSYEAAGSLQRVSDVRLGVIGFGRIGRAVASRARALGMEVAAHDPFVSSEEMTAASVRPEGFDELLRTSTAVSVHAPLTQETRGLIGERELALLPEGAYLVNVSRGALVDEAALVDALRERRIAGAAIDVFQTEPLPPDSPLYSTPSLVITPHTSWSSDRVVERSIDLFVANLRRFKAGEPLQNVVDLEAGY
jgi:D-3-phosphoglycerate dehydrogenase